MHKVKLSTQDQQEIEADDSGTEAPAVEILKTPTKPRKGNRARKTKKLDKEAGQASPRKAKANPYIKEYDDYFDNRKEGYLWL